MQQTEADVYSQEESGMERRLSDNATTTTTAAPTQAATTTAASNSSSGNSSSSSSSNGTASGNSTTPPPSTSAAAAADGSTTAAKVSEAETTGCFATVFNPLVAGMSLSLPFVMADDAQTKKLDRVDVLLPCGALTSALKDLDGDGSLDCTMTKEQSEIATVVPALDGSWKVSAAHTVAHGRRLASPHHEDVTFDSGAMCMDKISGAEKDLSKTLPTAVANVAGYTHQGKHCEADEASMWSFDLTYPASTCTPGLGGWVRPCTAKMMPDGKLVLIRGQVTQAGNVAQRPPLMEDIEAVHDVLPFANGLAAAAQSEFDILVLHKSSHVNHKAFVNADVDANGALSFSEFEAAVSKLPEHCTDAF